MYELNEREAFVAMNLYLQEFWRQTSGGHFPTLMADIEIEADGTPSDPAAWGDWLSALAQVKALQVPADPEDWKAWAAAHHEVTRLTSAST